MILPDHQIKERCKLNGLVIPYIEENVQPSSIDLTLSDEFMVSQDHDLPCIDLLSPDKSMRLYKTSKFILHPGEFCLGATKEYISLGDDIVGRVEGKSSLGRLGLFVHITAGYIDPGFEGNVTLELFNARSVPIILRPDKLICQIAFEFLSEPCEKPYKGRYQHDKGVVESRYGN